MILYDHFSDTKVTKACTIIYPVVIVILSIIRYNSATVSNLFTLSLSSFKFILPIFLNIFVESEVPNLLINPLLCVVLMTVLIKKWPVTKIFVFTLISSITSNFLSLVFFEILFFIPGFHNAKVCGSISIIISLAVAICYAYRQDDTVTLFVIHVKPSIVFGIICLWSFCCFKWPPIATISACFGFGVSFMLLFRFSHQLKIQPLNDTFNIQMLNPFPIGETHEKEPSILESLQTNKAPELSEADQSRRLRALRAIEERLESMQSKK